VTLTWADNATNETGYKIERSGDGVVFAEVATLSAGTASYSNTGLVAKSNYYYRVRAYNSAGNSSYSPRRVTTPDVPPAPAVSVGAKRRERQRNGQLGRRVRRTRRDSTYVA
jgi:hypothetical protein